jgi:hypothetical protein
MSHIDTPHLMTSFGPFKMVANDILHHWGIARKWLLPAIEHGDNMITEDEIVQGLLNKQKFLVYGQQSALIWENAGFEIKTIHFPFCGGNLKEIVEASPIIFDLARQSGFKRVHISGRRGWAKAFPNLREYCTTYKMEL